MYESGTHFNQDNNKIVKGAINSENAREMQARMIQSRADKRLAAARRGAMRGTAGIMPDDIFDEYDVIEAIAERQVELALSPDMRSSVQAARLVIDLLELTPYKGKTNVQLSQGEQSIRLEGIERDDLVSLLASIRATRE